MVVPLEESNLPQVPDDQTYRQRQRIWKLERDQANRAAGMAEFGGSATTADLVRQLRRRARLANTTARIVLAALIVVVIFGLGAYILWPVARQFVDGQRATLTQTLEAIDRVAVDLTKQREELRNTLVKNLTLAGEQVEMGTNADLNGHLQLADGSWLIYGGDGTVVLVDLTGEVQGPIQTRTVADLAGHLQFADGSWLIYGLGDTVLHIDGTGLMLDPIQSGKITVLLGHLQLADGSWLIYGWDGTVLHVDNLGVLQDPIQTGTDADLLGHLQLADGSWLIYGDSGSAVRVSGTLSNDLKNGAPDPAEPSNAAADDAAIRTFLENRLKGFSFDVLTDARVKIIEIIGQREIGVVRRNDTEANIEKLPSGAYFLDQQRQGFADFMAICRGSSDGREPASPVGATAADPDAVTLACAAAWQDKLASEAGNILLTLAQQVPPSILLLFLLATFGGLYRYNLRLAGFHHSRAGALELMILSEVEFDADILTKFSDALAADKVDFRAARTPADLATEMFKAAMQRTKPGG